MTTVDTKSQAIVKADAITVTIDGIEVAVPKGTLVIRAAEQAGIQIPRFCDHPLLAPAGACRQCLVDISTPGPDGSLRAMPKPQASCTIEATPGMVVATQHSSTVAAKAQAGVMELLLINHPLDCPVCDKGGECPLQNQAMSTGRTVSRFVDAKRTFPKPIRISTQILLDRERCVLCQRCTRFAKEIAGDPFIDLQLRGAKQQIGTFETVEAEHGVSAGGCGGSNNVVNAADEATPHAGLDESGRPFASYFSGNTVQICPVGALTSAEYRFRSRPFDLVSTEGVAEHDANGSAIRVDHRRGTVMRRLSGEDAAVNEEWITDKDRFAFHWQSAADRIETPMVRDESGALIPTSWSDALDVAARGLKAASDRGVGVLTGGRLTVEDAYAYSKFARISLNTNNIDLRARVHSDEELAFLGHAVAGTALGVTFADLEAAPAVLLVDFEPEDEGGIVFLRLNKAVRHHAAKVISIAPFASRGVAKLKGDLIQSAPGTAPELIAALAAGTGEDFAARKAALAQPGAIVIVGERAAGTPGTLSAVTDLVATLNASLPDAASKVRVAWIPRRAGERGAVDAGALPALLPGGRQVSDAAARVDVAAQWGVAELPSTPGLSTDAMLAAASAGDLGALVVAGVELGDLADPQEALLALTKMRNGGGFVVAVEVRESDVTRAADVVFPAAPPVERPGTFINWEGRARPFPQALTTHFLPDYRVLDALADELERPIDLPTPERVHAELAELGVVVGAQTPSTVRGPGKRQIAPPPGVAWDGARAEAPKVSPQGAPKVSGDNEFILATWRAMIDDARGQDGEPFLAGTARVTLARISAADAGRLGLREGDSISVGTGQGTITLPVTITDLPERVVWLPTNSRGSHVHETLGCSGGAVVRVTNSSQEDAEVTQ